MSKTEVNEVEILRQKVVEIQAKNESLETQLNVEIERRGLAEKSYRNLKVSVEIRLEEEMKKREEQRAHYIAQYDQLLEAFKAAQRARFGKKSERFVDKTGMQVSLFETSEKQEADAASTDPADIEDLTYKGQKNTGNQDKKNRKPRDYSGFPHREEVIPVSEEDKVCTCCGIIKDVIGYETSQQLDYKPATYELVTKKREKVACRKGCGGVLAAALPERLLPGCKATEPLLAHIFVSKVQDRQPLYHLEKTILQRHGWHIARSTMARWMIVASEKLQVLVNRMKETLLEYDIAAIDATTLQVLNEPNRPAEMKSYAYCIRGGPPDKQVVLYEYNAYTQKEYVDETLSEFKGVLQCDASPVFNKVAKSPDVTLSYCHAHARRKFEQIEKTAQKGKAKLASEAMRMYRQLYAIEREATEKGLSPAQRLALRREKSEPLLAQFREWLTKNQVNTLPQTPIGQAFAYCLKHWGGLTVYLGDGRVEIDNNATERQIKPFVMARKNFLFACTQAGADALGVHFSLVLTAQLHGWDPVKYYTHILTKLPSCKTWEAYDALLPWNGGASR